MDALVAVRARIAAAVLAHEGRLNATLGAVTLHAHQVEAVHRLDAAIAAYGGALLADAPGLGKTFVALALARSRGPAIVAAPAALRAQWRAAASRTGADIRFVSLETLSRRDAELGNERLLIVDEAHHLRNANAARYGRAARLALGRDVLLITATPVHNRREERDTLLALFLGARAGTLSDGDLTRLVVRRAADASLVPTLAPVVWTRLPQSRGIAGALRRLPPPLPAHDGRVAAALVRQGLALAWSSSVAALHEMLRRATHRAAALDDALLDGRWPTRAELRTWTIGDDASQMAFASLLGAPTVGDLSAARQQLLIHRRALDILRATSRACLTDDAAARARWLAHLMKRHEGECIVAFSRFEATVESLWRALRHRAGVVAVSSQRVRSAGGGLGHRELLAMLADEAPLDAASPIRLVLATDLLGEGVDLRRASVIVHLDQPWTPALAAQREGRAARLGARHARVAVYAVRPPAAAERLLTMSARLAHKSMQMEASVAPAEAHEALVQLVRPWLMAKIGRARVAAVRGASAGWIAVLRDAQDITRVIAASAGEMPRDDDALVLRLLRDATGDEVTVTAPALRAAQQAISAWTARQRSASLAGTPAEPGRRRLLALLDSRLGAVPLHERAALQRRAEQFRRVIGAVRGAGLERLLASAPADAGARELLAWLEDATSQLECGARAPQTAGSARVLALLLLA